MNYPAAAVGAGIGMMIALLIFSNAWRIGFLPKEYDFIYDFGNSLFRVDKKPFAYASRFIIGIVFHPIIFVFIWGEHGLLGINPYNNSILSAVILLLLEAILFSIVLWTRILGIPPRKLLSKIIVLQFTVHIIIGVLMGLTYEIFA